MLCQARVAATVWNLIQEGSWGCHAGGAPGLPSSDASDSLMLWGEARAQEAPEELLA